MSTQTITKKRKSTDNAVPASKKAKTAKSAEKTAPLKSALKKPKDGAPAMKKADKPAKVARAKMVEDVAEPIREATPEIEDAADLNADQTAALIAGFSSSEDEASDDEDGITISKLPQAPRIKDVQKQIKAATSYDPESTPGVIFLNRIPHGFYEPQMRAYFSQFGEILHLRLARNKKTGRSQHYAFMEFASSAVAEIVCKTMDKYLLFNRILQVRMVPRAQVKEGIWGGSGRKKKPAPINRIEGGRLRRGMVREGWEKRVGKEERRRKSKAEKLAEMGYEFEMPEVKAVSEVPKRVEAGGEPDVVEAAFEAEVPAEELKQIEAPVAEEEKAFAVPEAKAGKKQAASEKKVKKSKKVKT